MSDCFKMMLLNIAISHPNIVYSDKTNERHRQVALREGGRAGEEVGVGIKFSLAMLFLELGCAEFCICPTSTFRLKATVGVRF